MIPERRPFAWREVGVVVAAQAAVLLVMAPFYGPGRDELYFVSAGERLAWGYPDQPSFTPFLARLATEVAMLRADARRTPESQLTPREQQILARLAQGRSYGAIAADLSVSYKTVTNACSQMRQKLGVRTLAELIHVAVTHAQRQG